MTLKECGSHHSHSRYRKILYRVIWPLLITLFVVLLSIFLIWVIHRPSKPQFTLQDATVYNFNVSGNPPNRLSSAFQVTVSSRNPNGNIGIYYDSLDVYASYHSQQITVPTSIPTTYQRHKEVTVWSPFVGGDSVPVAHYNAKYLDQDHKAGSIRLDLHLDGKIRWKTFITREYHLHVRCLAIINFRNENSGVIVRNNAVKYSLTMPCSVSV
ncbi:hypothetical protein CARUB_v10003261mg [Capsella rubella]|uniref:Late embryogenesis abundant protein LEA-2 subgroup domain-containing protein n=1 Tax=Capsella rubella TaxID=81985 RepID=R0H4M9_9BRAS|nr:NDR1/HIN1-like protein 1 [Capsella rubella]EOA19660.1 hypothetical protein CARUB_v10003261mg [Capsella rubella]